MSSSSRRGAPARAIMLSRSVITAILPVVRLMESRQIYQHKVGEIGVPLCAEEGRFFLDTVAPILSEGDVLGSVVFTAPEENLTGGEVEYKLAQSIAVFLGKHMEG